MNVCQSGVSSCQRCRFYTLEGRRGGYCSQLGVPVQAKWSACALAVPFFVDALTPVAKLPVWSQEVDVTSPEPSLSESSYFARCH